MTYPCRTTSATQSLLQMEMWEDRTFFSQPWAPVTALLRGIPVSCFVGSPDQFSIFHCCLLVCNNVMETKTLKGKSNQTVHFGYCPLRLLLIRQWKKSRVICADGLQIQEKGIFRIATLLFCCVLLPGFFDRKPNLAVTIRINDDDAIWNVKKL